MKMRKILALMVAAVFVIALFAGCKPSAGDTTTTPGTTTTGPTTTAPGESTTIPASDERTVLRYGLSGYDGKFMPIMTDNVYDSQFCSLIFEPLVDVDAEAEYITNLAEKYELSEDKLTYTFTLKDGIKFADGTPLTSADVDFTYKMMAHKDYTGPRAYAVDALEGYAEFHAGGDEFSGIKIIDAKTISFTFAAGRASPANISNFSYGIMNKAYYEADTWENFLLKLSTPGVSGGSGPFIMTEYKPKELIRCEKNENYWDTSKSVKIDEVLGLEVANDSILSALQTDQIDFGEVGASLINAEALDAMPGVKRVNFLANGYTFLCFNTKNGIFDDVRVRQAFMYALDRKSFIEIEYGPLGMVGTAPISPVSWAFPKDTSKLNEYNFDLEKAAALLDEAGWKLGSDGIREKDGKKLSVRWLVYTESTWPTTLSGLAADSWPQVGIELKIELMDFNTVSDKTMNAEPGEKDFDIYTMGFSLDAEPDPKGGLFDADTYVAGGFDASGYRNEHAQELIEKGRTEFDQAKRAEIYEEWALIMNEQIPTIIVSYRNYLWGISDKISGMNISTFQDWTYSIFDISLQ